MSKSKSTPQMTRALIIGLAYILCVLVGITFVRAARSQELEKIPAERIQPIATKVAEILSEHGMPVKTGIPLAYYSRLNGDGMTVDNTIIVNSERPEECAQITIAHEYVHWVLGRDYGKQPDESEPVARAIEHVITTEFLPGCYSEYKRVPLSEALIAMRQK